MRWVLRHPVVAGAVFALILINVLYFFVSPQEIVEYVGVGNTYLVTFLIAAIGGLSTITGTTLYAAMATFASGGAHPVGIGLAGGAGIFLSDTVFFLLAAYGRAAIPPRFDRWVARIERTAQRLPVWCALVLVYLYLGFTPLPNDILMIALVIGGFRYRQVAPALLAGSFTIALLVAHLGERWIF